MNTVSMTIRMLAPYPPQDLGTPQYLGTFADSRQLVSRPAGRKGKYLDLVSHCRPLPP